MISLLRNRPALFIGHVLFFIFISVIHTWDMCLGHAYLKSFRVQRIHGRNPCLHGINYKGAASVHNYLLQRSHICFIILLFASYVYLFLCFVLVFLLACGWLSLSEELHIRHYLSHSLNFLSLNGYSISASMSSRKNHNHALNSS